MDYNRVTDHVILMTNESLKQLYVKENILSDFYDKYYIGEEERTKDFLFIMIIKGILFTLGAKDTHENFILTRKLIDSRKKINKKFIETLL